MQRGDILPGVTGSQDQALHTLAQDSEQNFESKTQDHHHAGQAAFGEPIEIKEAFNLFDTEQSGTIHPSQLLPAMLALGYDLGNETILQMFADLSQDGTPIGFDEFLAAATQNIGDKKGGLIGKQGGGTPLT